MPTAYVDLHHWEVRTFISGSGDKLEVFDGSVYVDWLTAGKTEGRNNDYFLNARQGRIYFQKGIPRAWRYPDGVRITYRYGDYEVQGNIHKLAVLMVVRELAPMDHRTMVTTGGVSPGQPMGASEITQTLDKRIERILGDTSWLRSPRKNWRISGGPHGR